MKRLYFLLFCISLFFTCLIETQAARNANTKPGFNPSGDYHPLKETEDKSDKFAQFVLKARKKRDKWKVVGDVRNTGISYKFASYTLTEKHLRFTTVKVGGVFYTFDGKFVLNGNFAKHFSKTGRGVIALEGTLQKFVHGKKKGKIKSSFLYYPGC